MRDIKDMHWFLWEAIVMQVRDMYAKGLLTASLISDVNFISTSVRNSGVFSDRLKIMACGIEVTMLERQEEWRVMIDAEMEEMYAAEMR